MRKLALPLVLGLAHGAADSAAGMLLALGGRNTLALLAGVALLQSATPVALAASVQLLPRRPATAAGLALGLAIAIGGVPALGGLGAVMGDHNDHAPIPNPTPALKTH